MFRLHHIENGKMNVPEPIMYEKDFEWLEDAVYSATGTQYSTKTHTPVSQSHAKYEGAHAYNSAEDTPISWTCTRAIKEGTAVKLNSGKIERCTGTTKPTLMVYAGLPVGTEKTYVAVYHITPEMVFEVETSADASSNKVGTVVTIAADAERVTATASSGVATIVENHAAASGDKIFVRFA